MFFRVKVRAEAFHTPTDKWWTYETTHGLRAVSRKHALDKGLRVGMNWPGYKDRADHPDWKNAGVEVTLLDDKD